MQPDQILCKTILPVNILPQRQRGWTSTINLSSGAMGWHWVLPNPAGDQDGQGWGQDVSSQPRHVAHSSSWSEGASPSPPGTAKATPTRKQAEPGAPNLKPGTAPGRSVAKRSAEGQPAHTREQDKFPSSWSVGELHRSQRRQPWGLQPDAFGFFWSRRGKNPAASPCPQQGARANESQQAPVVWAPRVTLWKQCQSWLEV